MAICGRDSGSHRERPEESNRFTQASTFNRSWVPPPLVDDRSTKGCGRPFKQRGSGNLGSVCSTNFSARVAFRAKSPRDPRCGRSLFPSLDPALESNAQSYRTYKRRYFLTGISRKPIPIRTVRDVASGHGLPASDSNPRHSARRPN